MVSAAIIENGIVINMAVAPDQATALARGWVPTEAAGIGWSYDGETFAAPTPAAPIVPLEVDRRQARLALLAAGLLDTIDAMVDTLPGTQGASVRIYWYDSNRFRRDSPLIALLASQVELPGGQIGLTEAQIDQIFIAAEQYT